LDKGLADLTPAVSIPNRLPDRKYVFHLYIIQVDRRDELLSFLLANDIEAKVHYPIPLHLQKAFEVFGYKRGDFPVTEKLCKRIITLPVHQHLEKAHIDYMIKKVREFYA
jgi:dTDP-4-amino-4,6-dideoxygalactose transaminase